MPLKKSRPSLRLVCLFAALAIFLWIPSVGVRAASLTTQSLSLSSDAKGEINVHYTLDFTAETNGTNAVVVEFCKNSSVVTDTCETVGGLDVTAVATTGSDTVSRLFGQAVLIDLSATANASDTVSVELTGITNPYDPGTMYARIVTYANATDAGGYESGTPGTHLDDGGVVLSISDGVAVGGAVLETLEFCASGSTFDGSGCAGTLTNPNMDLGGGNGLGTNVTTASVYTRVSTNAASGAVVSLKSNMMGCGGLALNNDPYYSCYIEPLTAAGPITGGAAKFGLKLGTITGGTGAITPAGSYGQTDYFMHYVSGDSSGVTSFAGDPIYTTDNAPLSGGEAELIFGANRADTTPAGDYGAVLSLLATGKF